MKRTKRVFAIIIGLTCLLVGSVAMAASINVTSDPGALGAEGVGRLVVGRQDVLLHFNDARLIHDASFAGAEPCRPAPSKYCLTP